MDTTRSQARKAGLLYFLACFTAPFALLYVPGVLYVPGDATATADRVRASGTLLRLGIAAELVGPILLVFAVLAFYRLLKDVSASHAAAMAVLMLISVPISFVVVLTEIAARIFAGNAPYLAAFDRLQLDAMTLLSLRLHGQGLLLAQVFWGLWLFPLGILVMRSGFIPRIIGAFLILAGSGYVISSFTGLLLPQYLGVVSRLAMVLEAGEAPFILWLIIRGASTLPRGAAVMQR